MNKFLSSLFIFTSGALVMYFLVSVTALQHSLFPQGKNIPETKEISWENTFFSSAAAGFGIPDFSLLSDSQYLSWPSSETIKATDTTAQSLQYLVNIDNKQWQSVIDMNGDGLNDVLVHSYSANSNRRETKLAVFFNKGNLTFDFAYKCVRRQDYINNNWAQTFYGDCADAS